jgi:hypothetical protein
MGPSKQCAIIVDLVSNKDLRKQEIDLVGKERKICHNNYLHTLAFVIIDEFGRQILQQAGPGQRHREGTHATE